MQITTETYKNAKEYEKGVQRMTKQGWIVQSSISHQPRSSIGRLLFVPFAMVRPPKPTIVVTYQRTEQSAIQPSKPQIPPGLSFKEQIRWHMEQNKKR